VKESLQEVLQKSLSNREHHCPNCGVELPRDLNSAKLIKRLGILNLRCPPPDGGSSPAEHKPTPSLQGMASKGVEAGSHPLKWVEESLGLHPLPKKLLFFLQAENFKITIIKT